MSVCLSAILYWCPVTRNTIPGLLLHYGSLDKYTDRALITQMNLAVFHCMCISVCIHTCRAISSDRAGLSRRYGTRIRFSSNLTSSLRWILVSFRSTSCFRFPLNGATCCWNKCLLSWPPFLFTVTVITEYTVVLLQRANIQNAQHLISASWLKCRFKRRDVKVAGDTMAGGASLSL